MTLAQGKVTQYISPDPYIICSKYVSCGTNGLNMRGKVFAAVAAVADMADTVDMVAEMNWRHKVTPDRTDLINQMMTVYHISYQC